MVDDGSPRGQMISVNEKIRAQQCPLSPATPRQARQGDQLRPRRPGRYVVVIDEHCSESRRRLLIGQFKRTSAVHVLCLLNHALRGKDQLPVQLSRSLREMSNSLPFFQNLTRLQDPHLAKTQVSGSLSYLQNLTQLRSLDLANTQVSGSLSFVQNLTQLQILYLSRTEVSGSVTSLPLLTGLPELFVDDFQFGVPTEQQLTTFTQQHPGCETNFQ